jgi:AcrR family transcriptional regulator
MATPAARTSNRSGRRDQLLRVSLRLFREHGYHGTGINDIGEAAGVTGPAIYRHFATKDDLLVAAIIEGAQQIRDAAADAFDGTLPPGDALRLLCSSFVHVAVSDPDLIAVYLLEARHLPSSKRAPLTRRSRAYLDEYVRLLTTLRPELSPAVATTLVRAAVFMAASGCVDDQPSLPAEQLEDLLTERMVTVLLSPGSPARTS